MRCMNVQVYIDNRISEFIAAAKASVASDANCSPGATAPVEATTLPSVDQPAETLPTVSTEVYSFIDNTTAQAPTTLPQEEAPATTVAASGSDCQKDLVDLLLVIDTSGSVADAFLNERKFAEDLIKVVPTADFDKRLSVAAVRFDKTAQLEFGFETGRSQETVLSDIQAINFTGGETSLAAGFNTAMQEISKGRRQNARLVIVLVSGILSINI